MPIFFVSTHLHFLVLFYRVILEIGYEKPDNISILPVIIIGVTKSYLCNVRRLTALEVIYLKELAKTFCLTAMKTVERILKTKIAPNQNLIR